MAIDTQEVTKTQVVKRITDEHRSLEVRNTSIITDQHVITLTKKHAYANTY